MYFSKFMAGDENFIWQLNVRWILLSDEIYLWFNPEIYVMLLSTIKFHLDKYRQPLSFRAIGGECSASKVRGKTPHFTNFTYVVCYNLQWMICVTWQLRNYASNYFCWRKHILLKFQFSQIYWLSYIFGDICLKIFRFKYYFVTLSESLFRWDITSEN